MTESKETGSTESESNENDQIETESEERSQALNEARAQNSATIALIKGESVHELPTDLNIPPEALEVFLETFEGPLDLLLYLIRRQNLGHLDIQDIEILAANEIQQEI